jgi:hypothetical protein
MGVARVLPGMTNNVSPQALVCTLRRRELGLQVAYSSHERGDGELLLSLPPHATVVGQRCDGGNHNGGALVGVVSNVVMVCMVDIPFVLRPDIRGAFGAGATG